VHLGASQPLQPTVTLWATGSQVDALFAMRTGMLTPLESEDLDKLGDSRGSMQPSKHNRQDEH
jgi:hypothetical protein